MYEISKSLAEKLSNLTLSGEASLAPSAHYIALLSAIDDESSSYTEISASDYDRQPVIFDEPDQELNCYNSEIVTFSEPVSDWGNVVAIAIMDASNVDDGEILFVEKLSIPLTIFTGMTPSIPVGKIKVSLNGSIFNDHKVNLLNFCLRGVEYTETLGYVGLINSVNESVYVELSNPSYGREALDLLDIDVNGEIYLNTEVEFPEATSNYDLSVKYVGIFDSITDGNLMYVVSTDEYLILENDKYRIGTSSFKFKIS